MNYLNASLIEQLDQQLKELKSRIRCNENEINVLKACGGVSSVIRAKKRYSQKLIIEYKNLEEKKRTLLNSSHKNNL